MTTLYIFAGLYLIGSVISIFKLVQKVFELEEQKDSLENEFKKYEAYQKGNEKINREVKKDEGKTTKNIADDLNNMFE